MIRRLICKIFGHKWHQKMKGQLCDRCQIFQRGGV